MSRVVGGLVGSECVWNVVGVALIERVMTHTLYRVW